MPLRVIGIGHPHHPADAAGLALFEALKPRLPRAVFEHWPAPRPELALALGGDAAPLVLVDTLAQPPPGGGLFFAPWREGLLADERPVSSHGFGVDQVLCLAQALGESGDIWLLGVPPVSPLPGDWVVQATAWVNALGQPD